MPAVKTHELKSTVKRIITRTNECQYISGPAKAPANCPGETTAHFKPMTLNSNTKCASVFQFEPHYCKIKVIKRPIPNPANPSTRHQH